ncbi:MAG: GyrI-like domain-containing protein [Hyphomicrobium sp.]|nr:GyrI-like domain-containing protein [Hyphomicrobium sp.]
MDPAKAILQASNDYWHFHNNGWDLDRLSWGASPVRHARPPRKFASRITRTIYQTSGGRSETDMTTLEYLRPVTVVAARVTGPYSASAAQAWDLMFDWLQRSGAACDITPRYGLLLDDPRVTTPNDCRYEACIPLPDGFGRLPPGLSIKRTPYGAYARERHVGGKVGIARTISKIRSEWMSDHGLVSDTNRPMIEIHLDNPAGVLIAQQRIDVCLPVIFAADHAEVPVVASSKY